MSEPVLSKAFKPKILEERDECFCGFDWDTARREWQLNGHLRQDLKEIRRDFFQRLPNGRALHAACVFGAEPSSVHWKNEILRGKTCWPAEMSPFFSEPHAMAIFGTDISNEDARYFSGIGVKVMATLFQAGFPRLADVCEPRWQHWVAVLFDIALRNVGGVTCTEIPLRAGLETKEMRNEFLGILDPEDRPDHLELLPYSLVEIINDDLMLASSNVLDFLMRLGGRSDQDEPPDLPIEETLHGRELEAF